MYVKNIQLALYPFRVPQLMALNKKSLRTTALKYTFSLEISRFTFTISGTVYIIYINLLDCTSLYISSIVWNRISQKLRISCMFAYFTNFYRLSDIYTLYIYIYIYENTNAIAVNRAVTRTYIQGGQAGARGVKQIVKIF